MGSSRRVGEGWVEEMAKGLSLVVTVSLLVLSASATGSGPRRFFPFRKKHEPTELIAFHGPECDLCDEMEPFMRKVEKELGKRILRFDVGSSTKNYNLLLRLDHENRCGGLPYFYNRATHRAICGATTCDNLRKWANGEVSKEFFSPPVSQEYEEVIVRTTGLRARINKRLEKIKASGMSAMK